MAGDGLGSTSPLLISPQREPAFNRILADEAAADAGTAACDAQCAEEHYELPSAPSAGIPPTGSEPVDSDPWTFPPEPTPAAAAGTEPTEGEELSRDEAGAVPSSSPPASALAEVSAAALGAGAQPKAGADQHEGSTPEGSTVSFSPEERQASSARDSAGRPPRPPAAAGLRRLHVSGPGTEEGASEGGALGSPQSCTPKRKREAELSSDGDGRLAGEVKSALKPGSLKNLQREASKSYLIHRSPPPPPSPSSS